MEGICTGTPDSSKLQTIFNQISLSTKRLIDELTYYYFRQRNIFFEVQQKLGLTSNYFLSELKF